MEKLELFMTLSEFETKVQHIDSNGDVVEEAPMRLLQIYKKKYVRLLEFINNRVTNPNDSRTFKEINEDIHKKIAKTNPKEREIRAGEIRENIKDKSFNIISLLDFEDRDIVSHVIDVLSTSMLKHQDKFLVRKIKRYIAADFADLVYHYWEDAGFKDDKVKNAIQATRDYGDGKIDYTTLHKFHNDIPHKLDIPDDIEDIPIMRNGKEIEKWRKGPTYDYTLAQGAASTASEASNSEDLSFEFTEFMGFSTECGSPCGFPKSAKIWREKGRKILRQYFK